MVICFWRKYGKKSDEFPGFRKVFFGEEICTRGLASGEAFDCGVSRCGVVRLTVEVKFFG